MPEPGHESETQPVSGNVPENRGPAARRHVGHRPRCARVQRPGVQLEPTATGVSVRIPGCDNLAEPGQPDLPSRSRAGRHTADRRRARLGRDRGSGDGERRAGQAGARVRREPVGGRLSVRVIRSRRRPAELAEHRDAARVCGSRACVSTRCATTPRPGRSPVSARSGSALTFDRPAVTAGRPDPLDPVISGMLANGEQAIDWKLDPTLQDTTNFFARSPVWCRIKTDSTAVYRVTAADLKAAGFDPAQIAPATMKLYSIGRYDDQRPVPGHDGRGAGVREGQRRRAVRQGRVPGVLRRVAFVLGARATRPGAPTSSRTNNCWWLTWGGETGRRLETVRRRRDDRARRRRPTARPAGTGQRVPGPVRPALALEGHRQVAGHRHGLGERRTGPARSARRSLGDRPVLRQDRQGLPRLRTASDIPERRRSLIRCGLNRGTFDAAGYLLHARQPAGRSGRAAGQAGYACPSSCTATPRRRSSSTSSRCAMPRSCR